MSQHHASWIRVQRLRHWCILIYYNAERRAHTYANRQSLHKQRISSTRQIWAEWTKKEEKKEAMRRIVGLTLLGYNHQNSEREGKARSSKPETVLRPWGQLAIYSDRFFIQEGSAVVLSLTLVLPLSHCVPQIKAEKTDICRCNIVFRYQKAISNFRCIHKRS